MQYKNHSKIKFNFLKDKGAIKHSNDLQQLVKPLTYTGNTIERLWSFFKPVVVCVQQQNITSNITLL